MIWSHVHCRQGTWVEPSPGILIASQRDAPVVRWASRSQIGPLFSPVTTAGKTAFQPQCDVRVELEHSAWRAEDLPNAGHHSEIRAISLQMGRDRCMNRRPGNGWRRSACSLFRSIWIRAWCRSHQQSRRYVSCRRNRHRHRDSCTPHRSERQLSKAICKRPAGP